MTHIKFFRRNGFYYGFEETGHTGYGDAGDDVLCAALSAMTMLIINTIEISYACDVDYEVDENGLFYRTDEQRMNCADTTYKAAHLCEYSYLPQWSGTSMDGKNAMSPSEQPSEFMNDMAEPLKNCFDAYGYTTYPEFIHSVVETNGPWFPMYSYSNNFTTDTPGGLAWQLMGETKHEWLPKVVMAADFDSEYAAYMDAYNECQPQDFLAEMQEILDTFK